jgi:hypothetical protein
MSSKKILFAFCFLFFLSKSYAQKLEIGGGLGPTYYKGDLQPTFRLFSPHLGSNLFVRYNFGRTISFKVNGMLGIVRGDDARSGNPFNIERGMSFRNKLADYNAQVEYNFLNFRTHNGRYESKWTPYLFGGIGQIKLIEKRLTSPSTSVLERTQSPDYILPYGIGFKKIYKGKWNFGMEFGTRVLLNKKNADLFDGYGYQEGDPSSNYTSVSVLPTNQYYPNTTQKDKYFYLNFSVSYLFYKIHCPPGN